MRTIINPSLIICSLVLLLAGCRKHKYSIEEELAKLPPVTQTGAHTFGCLINGKAYRPKGFRGFKPSFMIIADPSYFGNLDIRTYNYGDGKKESLNIFCYDIKTEPGTYEINGKSRIWVFYENEVTNCNLLPDSSSYMSGFLKISKYDTRNGIIAGEFECKIYDQKTSCDTIRITNGRFDHKL